MVDSFFKTAYGHSPEAFAYAPGRIEFIGNHTDYNGGAVLGAAVDRGIAVAVGASGNGMYRFVSDAVEGEVVVRADDIHRLSGKQAWVNYPLGVIQTLRGEGLLGGAGIDFAAASTLPAGAGMSSSAAMELATAYALAALQRVEVDRQRMAQLCRRAENEFVGVPCGILDQGVSAFGIDGHLVHIDCLTETFTRVPMPAGCHFWIFNTNKKHALVESRYSERHRECTEAFEILRRVDAGAPCLARIAPELVRAQQPELGEIRFRRALHVTEENRRVAQSVEALQRGELHALGTLLTASHQSSRFLFENSCAELDYLVDRLVQLPGIYGARLTGGGFGGAVMALSDGTFDSGVEFDRMLADYTATFGIEPSVFHTRAGAGARAGS